MEKTELEKLIPHGPAMCLLDRVEAWDERSIVCGTRSHRRLDNPLLENGRLPAVALIEFGAQAAAIHAGLIQSGLGSASQAAFLGAVKDVRFCVDTVDTTLEKLDVKADMLLNNPNGAVYGFVVETEGRKLIEGRLTVVLSQPHTDF